MRASSRPKKISTSGRATWVDRMRSRRLVEAADVQRARVPKRDRGGARRERIVDVDDVEARRPPSSSSSGRLRSIGTGAARGRGPRGIARLEPTASTGGPPSPPARVPLPGRRRRAPPGRSRAAPNHPARLADRGPRARPAPPPPPCVRARRARPRPERRTRSPRVATPHGCGLTWAIDRRSASAHRSHGAGSRSAVQPSAEAEALPGPGLLGRGRLGLELRGALARRGLRACAAMNSSVSSRASSSGRWVCGDFIR